MKPSVYIETSVISYLTAKPSRDLIVAGHQQITQEWWAARRPRFELYVSQMVLQEAEAGDKDAAGRRMEALRDIPLLAISEETMYLAQRYLEKGPLPLKAAEDALHIAVATVHGMDYLLSWNCKHIANAEMRKAIVRISQACGYESPIICTPEELMGELS